MRWCIRHLSCIVDDGLVPGRRSTADAVHSAAFAGDLSKPVFRHLAERRWRKEGDLAILVSLVDILQPVAATIDPAHRAQMQRVTQMNITPDLLPSIDPEADVRYSINGETLVPGVFTLPSAVSRSVA